MLKARAFLCTLALLGPVVAWSQAVTIVVAAPAGGSVDVAARRLAAQAMAVLGESWVVNNAPGGGGGVARSQFERTGAGEAMLVLPDANVSTSAIQGLNPAGIILTQSFALVGRTGLGRPSVIAHAFGESTRGRALAESIAQALQATAAQYKGAAVAIFDAKQQDTWVLVESSAVPVAQREGLQVFAVGDQSLGLTDFEGRTLSSVTQGYPSFAALLGQPIPSARSTVSVYVQSAGGQALAAKLARLGTPATSMARPLPATTPAVGYPAMDDPKGRGRSARVM